MKIYNREHKTSNINILVPTFNNKKDVVATNIYAYLKDYKPLITQNKKYVPK